MPLFRSTPEPASDPDSLTAEGMQHMQDGSFQSAAAVFEAAIQLDPENGQAWYGKGCAHSELEQIEEAIHSYQQSAQFAGERAGLPLFNLGNLYQRLEQFAEAAKCFQQATQVDPTMEDAWTNLGRILDDAGQHAAAIECYDIAIEIDPDDVMTWSNRGNSLRSLERFEDGLASYQKALQLDSNDFAARIGIGACLVECGQPEKGLAALQKAVEQSKHPVAMFELATALAKTGRHEAAVAIYDTLIESEMTSVQTLNNRAECLASLQQIDASLECFDRAIELDSEFAPAWFGKARVLVNVDRIDEARPVAQQYLALADDAERSNPSAQALMNACNIEV